MNFQEKDEQSETSPVVESIWSSSTKATKRTWNTQLTLPLPFAIAISHCHWPFANKVLLTFTYSPRMFPACLPLYTVTPVSDGPPFTIDPSSLLL